jgi:hypothetical protein
MRKNIDESQYRNDGLSEVYAQPCTNVNFHDPLFNPIETGTMDNVDAQNSDGMELSTSFFRSPDNCTVGDVNAFQDFVHERHMGQSSSEWNLQLTASSEEDPIIMDYTDILNPEIGKADVDLSKDYLDYMNKS